MPPLHHEVVTASVAVDAADARDAARALERSLASLESTYPSRRPASASRSRGGFRTSGVSSRRSGSGCSRSTAGRETPALLDASPLPERPRRHRARAERRRSCCSAATASTTSRAAEKALFDDSASSREHDRFARGSRAAGCRASCRGGRRPRRRPDPDGGGALPRLHLDARARTSVRRRIANLETLGLVEIPDGYFVGGTHMHLSHIHENLEAWYVNIDHDDRVHTTFRPGLRCRPGR